LTGYHILSKKSIFIKKNTPQHKYMGAGDMILSLKTLSSKKLIKSLVYAIITLLMVHSTLLSNHEA
jgi:hypothetical protein